MESGFDNPLCDDDCSIDTAKSVSTIGNEHSSVNPSLAGYNDKQAVVDNKQGIPQTSNPPKSSQ
jgi:hypothetical protein